MNHRIVTILLAAALTGSLLMLVGSLSKFQIPGNQQGYEPGQPIAYSHRLHAGELQIACLYCHFSAEKSRHAGIPPLGVCMNCHRYVTASLGALRAEDELATKEKRQPRMIVSPELQKLYDSMALNAKLERDQARSQQPVAWTKVHNLPDFVYFDHRAHVRAKVACQQCHGPVETMERMRQVSDLSMGWCVNCHRDVSKTGVDGMAVHASVDCSVCHY